MPEISFDNLGDIFPKGSLNEETFWREKSDEEKARIKKAEDALLPCPLCGGKSRIEVDDDWAGPDDTYGVVCDSCRLYTPPFFKTLEDAVAFWNRRVKKEPPEKKKVVCNINGGPCSECKPCCDLKQEVEET